MPLKFLPAVARFDLLLGVKTTRLSLSLALPTLPYMTRQQCGKGPPGEPEASPRDRHVQHDSIQRTPAKREGMVVFAGFHFQLVV